MLLIAITSPDFLPGEGDRIASLLRGAFWRVHIRKPGAKAAELKALLDSIPAWCLPRLVLHDHQELALDYRVGGIHLNSRQRSLLPELRAFTAFADDGSATGRRLTVSRSCHSLGEVAARKATADYLFLSPIFDSISKQGYRSRFSADELRRAAAEGIIDGRVFALGGVTMERVPVIEEIGFGGAAMLGSVWGR